MLLVHDITTHDQGLLCVRVGGTATLVGPAVGAFLFAAGLMQARRLATGDVQATRQAARTIGSTRVAVGGLFAARPQLFARLLNGGPSPTR
jgi:ABC-type branched-subunit amino acid transport system permease subunit